MGSPEYMSPEQAIGDQLDARSDVYSLGCVLFEMLTGDPPFTGSIPQAILAKKLQEAVPSPRVVRDSVPEHVERAVRIALAKSPADRFTTAEEFRQALDGQFGDRAIVAGGPAAGVGSVPVTARSSHASASKLVGIVAAVVAGVGALLAVIGILTTRVYDLKLGIPFEYRPSRTDFLTVGAHTLVPALLICFAGAVAYVALRFALRGASVGLHHVPGVGQTLEVLQERTTVLRRRLWRPAEAATVADAYFIGGIIATVAVLTPFRRLLAAIGDTNTDILACSFRDLHDTYSGVITLLIAGLLLAWHEFSRYVRRRGATGGRIALAKWGGLAWVIIMVIVMTLPWRLLWDNTHERALLDGQRTYILTETDTEWVIYNPISESTDRVRKGVGREIERLGTSGYLFEDRDSFLGVGTGC